MNLITCFLVLLIALFIIGFIAAICEQHSDQGADVDDEGDDLGIQSTVVVSQEVPNVFDNFSKKQK